MKKLVKQFIPPIISKYNRLRKKKYGWFGNYKTWSDALTVSTGYNAENILKKVESSITHVKNGDAVFERDSVLLDKKDYSFPLLTALLLRAVNNDGTIKIIDFGGSLGSSYFQCRDILSDLKDIKWIVIEQKKFVDCGVEKFQNNELFFRYNIQEAVDEFGFPDIFLISSTLEYLENPYLFLEDLEKYKFTYIFFDKTPFWSQEDRITLQKVNPRIYAASYPCWIFNEEKFIKFFSFNYEIIFSSDNNKGNIAIDDCHAQKKNYLLRRKNDA